MSEPLWTPMEFDQIVASRKSTRASRYEKHIEAVTNVMRSTDKKHVEVRKRANAALLRTKDLGPAQVHVDAALASISVQYANDEYIGDTLMPEVSVPKKSDKYFIYDKRARLAAPSDDLGPRGQANEVTDTRSTDNYSCDPRGFENYLDAETLANQDAPLDEMVDLVEAVNEMLALRREIRIATILTTTANFGSNTTNIAAASRWDSAGGGNPISDIQNARKNIWSGRGPGSVIGYCDYDTYLTLSRHPAILDLFKYNGSSPGLATPKMIAGFLEMDALLVGKARNDTANEGQTAAYSRIWGRGFGILRVAKRPGLRTAAFGYTLVHGAKNTIEWFDPRAGVKGGYFAKVTSSETHKVVASDTGFFIGTPTG